MTQYLRNSLVDEEKDILTSKNEFSLSNLLDNKTDVMVLSALKEFQPATRMDLCEKTGIPRTTIYDSLTRLMLKNVVTKYSKSGKAKGRPKVFYQVIQES